VRGAIELDPSFVQPHLTLAGWTMFRDPAQTLVHCGAIVERMRNDFNLQVDFAANSLALGLEALFAGLLLTGLGIVLLRSGELSHGLQEQLGTVVSKWSARLWVIGLLAVPFLAGAGLTLPVLLMLAFLWEPMRKPERVLFVVLAIATVTAPLALGALGRFALALRTEARPFYELPMLEHAPWQADRQAKLEALASRDPENGFVQFALGWYSRRDGRFAQAERAYAAALEAWPEHSAVLTDLGNVLAMRGQIDRALELYQRAATSDPQNAAAHFNISQLLTRRFEYARAQDELRLASSIDFDLVKRYQTGSGANGLLPLADVWPGPPTFWHALQTSSVPAMPLPLAFRGWRETSGWAFSFAALVAIAIGRYVGRWQHRRLPIRYCSNCRTVVCRRCAKRRREAAVCEACDRVGAGATTQDFSRVLLHQHLDRRRAVWWYVRAGLATLVPGFGLLSMHRVVVPVVQLTLTWLIARFALGQPLPFSVTARFAVPGSEVPGVLLGMGFVIVYAWSLLGYAVVSGVERRREAESRALTRSRVTQATQRDGSIAA
jgi:tetratricopeptide (TPR) repeat protein